MRKMSLIGFAVLLGAALIFSGCEGETTTETKYVLANYEIEITDVDELAAELAGNTYSYILYTGNTFYTTDPAGTIAIPVGKVVGFSAIANAGSFTVNGILNVESGGSLLVNANIDGNGSIIARPGGKIETAVPVANLPAGLKISGGELIAGTVGNGSLATLLTMVERGKIDATTEPLPLVEFNNISGLSNTKTLSGSASSGTIGAGGSLTIPIGLFLTTNDGIYGNTNGIIVGGQLLLAAGSLTLAQGKTFTLNSGGVFQTTNSAEKGLIIGTTGANSGTVSLYGTWVADTTVTITGNEASPGGTISGGMLTARGGTIDQGTTSKLYIFDNTTIDLNNSGVLVLHGTESAGSASLYFNGQNAVVLLGESSKGTEFTSATLEGAAGSTAYTFGLAYGTAAGGSLASIAGSLASTVGSVSAGTTDVFYVLHGGTVVTQ